jgi:hypothetical protein
MIWTIPKDGLKDNLTTPAVVLDGHSRKVFSIIHLFERLAMYRSILLLKMCW